MSVRIEVSQEIDRPLPEVFQFYAVDHVLNHPRWDPQMKLEQVSPGPIGVGTIVRRINSHSGTPVEGTMEVTEFQLNRSIASRIRDGAATTLGGAAFEEVNARRTRLTVFLELPAADPSMDTTVIRGLMERSLHNIKQLIESES